MFLQEHSDKPQICSRRNIPPLQIKDLPPRQSLENSPYLVPELIAAFGLACPFNSITMMSIAVSLVFSGK
jgi:hypothetical protein